LENRIDEVKKQLSSQDIEKKEAVKIKSIKDFNLTINGKSYTVNVEEL